MKSRLPVTAVTSKEQRKAIRAYAEDVFKKQSQEHVRRVLKIVCVSLYEEYGFARHRLGKLVHRVNELSCEKDTDPVYWTHIDRVLQSIGMDFIPEDYNQMGE